MSLYAPGAAGDNFAVPKKLKNGGDPVGSPPFIMRSQFSYKTLFRCPYYQSEKSQKRVPVSGSLFRRIAPPTTGLSSISAVYRTVTDFK